MPERRVRVPCFWCKGEKIVRTAPMEECDAAKREGRPVVWDEEPCGFGECDENGTMLVTLRDPEAEALMADGERYRALPPAIRLGHELFEALGAAESVAAPAPEARNG